jgi:hypothetical protein
MTRVAATTCDTTWTGSTSAPEAPEQGRPERFVGSCAERV